MPCLVAKGSKVQDTWNKQLYFDCGLDLEDGNPYYLHDTSGRDDAPTYQVSLKKIMWFRRYSVKTNYIILLPEDSNLHFDLEDSNPKLSLWLVMMHHYIKLGCK